MSKDAQGSALLKGDWVALGVVVENHHRQVGLMLLTSLQVSQVFPDKLAEGVAHTQHHSFLWDCVQHSATHHPNGSFGANVSYYLGICLTVCLLCKMVTCGTVYTKQTVKNPG